MKTANSILAGVAGTLLLALGTTVNAEEQLILSDADMDGVTAGYNWSSAGAGASFSGWSGGATSYSSTFANPYYTDGYASASAAGIWGTSSASAGSTSVSY